MEKHIFPFVLVSDAARSSTQAYIGDGTWDTTVEFSILSKVDSPYDGCGHL